MIPILKTDIFSTYLSQLNKIPSISDAEFEYLYKLSQKGVEKAKRRMVEGNLKLVVKVAMKYANLGLSMMDLVEEGNLGLMLAVDKFREQKGAKFSTYAIWWIKQKIRRALDNQTSLIHIPSYAVQNIRKCVKYWDELSQAEQLERTDIERIAENLNLTLKEVKNVIYALEVSKGPASLDAPINDDDEMTFGDVFVDVSSEDDPCDLLEKEIDLKAIPDLLNVLNDKEKKIITQRFGLDGEEILTLSEIGKEWGVSRERIRQVAENAILKMQKCYQRTIHKD